MNIDIPSVCQSLKSQVNFTISKNGNLGVPSIAGFFGITQKAGFVGTIFNHLPSVEESFDKTTALYLRSRQFDAQIQAKLLESMVRDKEAAKEMVGSTNLDSHVKSPIKSCKYIHNITNNKANAIYVKTTDNILGHREPMIKERLKLILGDEYSAWLLENTVDCIPMTIPLSRERFVVSEGDGDHLRLNTWAITQWLHLYEERGGFNDSVDWDGLPEIVVEFFDGHFFTTQASREWFMGWTKAAMFSRPETMAMFVGEKGTGKNIIVEDFLGGLFHKDNILPLGDGFTRNHFQDGIQYKQILAFDEFELDKKGKNKFKRLMNARGQLEAKTVQAGDPVQFNFAMIMMSNNWMEFKLDLNDRRFSALDITTTPLLKVWNRKKIKELCSVFADEEFQYSMASYLHHKVPDDVANVPVPSQLFAKMCFNSLPNWFQRFIEYCKYHRRFDKRAFFKGNGAGRQTGEPAIQRELLNYKQMCGIEIARVRKDPTHEWVAISKTYDKALVEELERLEEQEMEEELHG